MNSRGRTYFPLGDSRHINLSFDWRFIASQLIRNSRTPGCGLFNIPKNCGRRDFKLTSTHSSPGSATKITQHSHATPASYAGLICGRFSSFLKIESLSLQCTDWIFIVTFYLIMFRNQLRDVKNHRAKQERIKGTEKACPIHTLFHR